MPNKRLAICFDWDGTIIDSMNDKFDNFISAILHSFEINTENSGDINKISSVIDFCHKEYGGELRVYQFDNVLDSLSHPEDLLRVLVTLAETPDTLKESSYLRERHLYSNFQDELEENADGIFTKYITNIVDNLKYLIETESEIFDFFQRLKNRRTIFELFDTEYSRLNQAQSEKWKPFAPVQKVLEELSVPCDLYIVSSLLTHLLEDEVAQYSFSSLFKSCRGGSKEGNLREIKQMGYERVAFVGDMPADRSAANTADVDFYRIHSEPNRAHRDWMNMVTFLDVGI